MSPTLRGRLVGPILALGTVLLAGAVPAARPGNQDRTPLVLEAQLDAEPLTPGSVSYLERAIATAEERHAECLVIRLDTPGGLLDSTRSLVRHILASEVPVVVFVAPDGARAASAGVFVTLAAHVAAMAPGATIGAAHPVMVGGLPIPSPAPSPDKPSSGSPSESDTMMGKLVEDTASWARALAARRGRSADWAEKAVRESVSITGREALQEKVVDVLASDRSELLKDIDGRRVIVAGRDHVLRTENARVELVDPTVLERFLAFVSQPNVAFLLLMLGFYAILIELAHPGLVVPGVVGVLALVSALFGLAVLPVSGVGLSLIFLGLALFVAEVFVTSFGLLTIGGIVCLVLGGSMLVDSPTGFARVSLALVVPVAAATALITVGLAGLAVRAMRRPATTGADAMLGTLARVREAFRPDGPGWSGQVFVHGERWLATAPTPLAAGSDCRIVGRDGLRLTVEATDASAA